MSPQERFTTLVKSYVAEWRADVQARSESQNLLDTKGRSFNLDFSQKRQDVTVSTPVYVTDNDPTWIYPDLVADFNAWHLFHGGYRLSVDPLTQCLYVSVAIALDRIESAGLATYLDDFISRCVTCTRWYVDEVSRRVTETLTEVLTKEDVTGL